MGQRTFPYIAERISRECGGWRENSLKDNPGSPWGLPSLSLTNIVDFASIGTLGGGAPSFGISNPLEFDQWMYATKDVLTLIFSYITASLASIPLLIWAEPFSFHSFSRFDWQSWAAFAFLALFMYGASMLLFFEALRHLDVTTASTSLYLVPVFGVILAAALLGERLNASMIAGSAIVLLATLLIMKYDVSY